LKFELKLHFEKEDFKWYVKKDVRILKGYLTNSCKGFIFSCKWIGEGMK
jgi:hypothetical protein